jgi:hypothetical protein
LKSVRRCELKNIVGIVAVVSSALQVYPKTLLALVFKSMGVILLCGFGGVGF